MDVQSVCGIAFGLFVYGVFLIIWHGIRRWNAEEARRQKRAEELVKWREDMEKRKAQLNQ